MDLQSLGVGSEGSFLKEGPMSRARVGKEGGTREGQYAAGNEKTKRSCMTLYERGLWVLINVHTRNLLTRSHVAKVEASTIFSQTTDPFKSQFEPAR